jgi:hypothetical protein
MFARIPTRSLSAPIPFFTDQSDLIRPKLN